MKKMIAAALLFMFCACRTTPKADIAETDVPMLWADMTLFITKHTPANTPTFASRSLGYIGLTMYESIVKGYPPHLSVAGQLNKLTPLPDPEKGKPYSWILSLKCCRGCHHQINLYSDITAEP